MRVPERAIDVITILNVDELIAWLVAKGGGTEEKLRGLTETRLRGLAGEKFRETIPAHDDGGETVRHHPIHPVVGWQARHVGATKGFRGTVNR